MSPRELLRALKLELPKAAKQILNPSRSVEDIDDLVVQASMIDGVLAKHPDKYLVLAKQLRLAGECRDPMQKLIHYCIAGEILTANNKKELPLIKQFGSKLALIRAVVIKTEHQQDIHDPETMRRIFNEIYNLRSLSVHGGSPRTTNRQIADFINILYPTVRMALSLQNSDPNLMDFIRGM